PRDPEWLLARRARDSFPTRRSSDLSARDGAQRAPLFSLEGGPGMAATNGVGYFATEGRMHWQDRDVVLVDQRGTGRSAPLRCPRSEEHTSELQSRENLVCRLLLEKK